jgi:type IV secretory pathway VirD2 relaxase
MSTQSLTDATEPSRPEKKRGRPATGNALSASARQARRREKLAAEGKGLLPPAVVSQEVLEALAKYIQFKDMTLGDAVEKIVRHRLLRKRSGKRKPRVSAKGF